MNRAAVLTVYGRVQGVGYRYFTKQKADSLGICGKVKNQSNGTVYIEAEGESEILEMFINACKQGPSHAWVEKVDVQYCPVQNYIGFSYH